MASSSNPPFPELFLQHSYKPESDSIKNFSRFFEVKENEFVGIDLVKKGLKEVNQNRSFYITNLDEQAEKDSFSNVRIHIFYPIKKGELVGILKGVVLQKEVNDLKRMEWPVLLINYDGQQNISALQKIINPDYLTLKRVGRAKNEGNTVFVLRPESNNNPLRSILFLADPSQNHNCTAKFVLSDSQIFLCLIAKEDIKENSIIQVFSQDILLYESYGSWRGRQKTKPGNIPNPSSSAGPKPIVSENPPTSTEPRTRYQKKQSKEEEGQEVKKENSSDKIKKNVRRVRSNEESNAGPSNKVHEQRTRSGEKQSNDDGNGQEDQANNPKPLLHKIVRRLRSNDVETSSKTNEHTNLKRTRSGNKRSREEVEEAASNPEELSTIHKKSKEDNSKPNSEKIQKPTTSSSPHSFPEPSEMLKGKLDAAKSIEEETTTKPAGRVLRPRKDNDPTSEQPKPTTKKILSRTQSVPVERIASGSSSEKMSRKTKRSEDEENQENEKTKKPKKKIKTQEVGTIKPKSNSAPTAVLKEKIGNINLTKNGAGNIIKLLSESLRFRKPFENGRKFTLHHVGILVHQTEEYPVSKDKKKISSVMKLENLRRSRMKESDIDKKFIKDWYEVFNGLFNCEHVGNLQNSGCEDIKKYIEKKKEQCEREFGYVGNDKGVLFVLVFTSAFMDNLQIKLNRKEDPVNLITDIIIPIFEVKNRSAQRFFPFIILETSTGVHIWKQNGNKISEFEFIRFSAGAPNEAVLENHITMMVRELAKQLKTEYNDSNVSKTDLIKVLQRTKEEDYKTFRSTEYQLQKHKLFVEHSTSKPFTLEKPRDVEKDLEDDEVEGKFLLIQHCTDESKDYNFEIKHNRIVKPMRYLKCKRAFPAISDYYDKDDEFKHLFDKADAEIKKAKMKVKVKTVNNLNKVKHIKARLADWNDISKRFPGFSKKPLRLMKCKEKFDITKERREEIMEEIQKAAEAAVKDDTPYLVLVVICRGKYEYFWLGEVPQEDDPDFEKYICRYSEIIDKVRETGLKKLFIIAGHYVDELDQSEELPTNMFKGKYPQNTIGGTPSTYHIRLKNVRIENSVPQHSILWAAPPGYQLPLSKSKKEFSPLLHHFQQIMREWPEQEEINFDLIVQKANKLSMKCTSGPESVILRDDDPDKTNPDLKTHAQFYLASSMIFKHSWKIRKTDN